MGILAIYSGGENMVVAVKNKQDACPKLVIEKGSLSIMLEQIVSWLKQLDCELRLIVTNGHLEHAAKSGIYILSRAFRQVKGSCGAVLTHTLANYLQIPAYVIDPSSPKEFEPEAFVTGSPEFTRRCFGDVFVFKYLARLEATKTHSTGFLRQFIIASLDKTIQIGAVKGERVVDFGSSFDEGPFSWNQSGRLPVDQLLSFCAITQDRSKVLKHLQKESGLIGYLGQHIKFEDLWHSPNPQVVAVRQGFVYQIAKEIGAYATVLQGRIDAILLTGEFCRSEAFVAAVAEAVEFLGEISVYGGDLSLKALFAGADRIIGGEPILQLE